MGPCKVDMDQLTMEEAFKEPAMMELFPIRVKVDRSTSVMDVLLMIVH